VRDAIDAFRAIDTEPYGVNEADAASHRSFIDELNLPFDLLVDDGFAVSRAYGALKSEGRRINRTVVVVGKNGAVLFYAHGAPKPEEIITAIVEADDDG
jgi:peroxiredoxin Q/BCP